MEDEKPELTGLALFGLIGAGIGGFQGAAIGSVIGILLGLGTRRLL